MTKVFISYTRDGGCGQALAIETQSQLEDAGIEVFRDVTGLNGGDFWLRKLEEELRASDVVVLILSEKVLTSKWVPNEINLAEELGIPVIPIFAEQIQLPLWLRHLQVIDFVSKMPWMKLHGAIVRQTGGNQHSSISKSIITAGERYDSSWANCCGKDRYGQYADLRIYDVVQRFRLIKPGSFWMGSSRAEKGREFGTVTEVRHRARVSPEFWMADTACTQALWRNVMGDNPSHFKDNESNPVENISWNNTQKFIQILNNANLRVSFRLPTEAEWEYSCRAGTNTPFSFGENITTDQVNYDGSFPYNGGKEGISRKEPVPVKSLAANKWGLYEMHGNVWEWCEDAYREVLASESCTELAYKLGTMHVVRGGSCFSRGRDVRSACRRYFSPELHNSNIGLRLSLVVNT